MRLTIPEPRITLYQDGFDGIDRYGRKEIGQRLSDLIENIDDPMVIALDGGWGEGKTVFLKCWVGEHLKRDSNTTRTVYFDAFKHDFLDDPLIGLTGEISDRIAQDSTKTATKIWDKARRVAPSLARGAFRAGVAIATAGIVQRADDLVDAAAESVGQDIAGSAEKFWQAHQGRVEAMETFRTALVDLTEPDQKGSPTRKLVLVVDELDRCRPDYALSMLEIIKHFFNVPGVHFVLGTSLTALENSVRARYGDGIDAGRYLQKFVSVILPISGVRAKHIQDDAYLKHFENCCHRLEIIHGQEYWPKLFLKMLQPAKLASLRDVEKLAVRLATSPTPRLEGLLQEIAMRLWGGVLVMKVLSPTMYSELREGKLSLEGLMTLYDLDYANRGNNDVEKARSSWHALLGTGKRFSAEILTESRNQFGTRAPNAILTYVISNCIDAFIHPDEQ